uniref:Uncharacterized protein n=1 Tax=Arundo donax TaxID=35708 RepID=A0A0A9CTY3_ARUDO
MAKSSLLQQLKSGKLLEMRFIFFFVSFSLRLIIIDVLCAVSLVTSQQSWCVSYWSCFTWWFGA